MGLNKLGDFIDLESDWIRIRIHIIFLISIQWMRINITGYKGTEEKSRKLHQKRCKIHILNKQGLTV